MVRPGGSTVPAAFGARPLYEADLLVRVKDAAINHARTPEEVLQHIDQVIPFIELPDLVVQARPGDHIVCMSNGSFGGIHAKLLNKLSN